MARRGEGCEDGRSEGGGAVPHRAEGWVGGDFQAPVRDDGGVALCGGCVGYPFPFGLNCCFLCSLGYGCETVLFGAARRFCP